jgi:hypothetical protein
MDISVKAAGADGPWQLTDLLGRSTGAISRLDGEFTIVPHGHALETMKDMNRGPFRSLDAALAEIEKRTLGTCRLDGPGQGSAIPADNLNASNDE